MSTNTNEDHYSLDEDAYALGNDENPLSQDSIPNLTNVTPTSLPIHDTITSSLYSSTSTFSSSSVSSSPPSSSSFAPDTTIPLNSQSPPPSVSPSHLTPGPIVNEPTVYGSTVYGQSDHWAPSYAMQTTSQPQPPSRSSPPPSSSSSTSPSYTSIPIHNTETEITSPQSSQQRNQQHQYHTQPSTTILADPYNTDDMYIYPHPNTHSNVDPSADTYSHTHTHTLSASATTSATPFSTFSSSSTSSSASSSSSSSSPSTHPPPASFSASTSSSSSSTSSSYPPVSPTTLPPGISLDLFLTKVYHYYQDKGLIRGIVTRSIHVLSLLFTIFFSAFFLLVVKWSSLFDCPVATCSIFDWGSLTNMNSFEGVFVIVYFSFLLLYWCVVVVHSVMKTMSMYSISLFYKHNLLIDDEELATIEWNQVTHRLIRVLSPANATPTRDHDSNMTTKSGTNNTLNNLHDQMSIDNGNNQNNHHNDTDSSHYALSVLDISNRILRREHYLTAIIKSGVLNLKAPPLSRVGNGISTGFHSLVNKFKGDHSNNQNNENNKIIINRSKNNGNVNYYTTLEENGKEGNNEMNEYKMSELYTRNSSNTDRNHNNNHNTNNNGDNYTITSGSHINDSHGTLSNTKSKNKIKLTDPITQNPKGGYGSVDSGVDNEYKSNRLSSSPSPSTSPLSSSSSSASSSSPAATVSLSSSTEPAIDRISGWAVGQLLEWNLQLLLTLRMLEGTRVRHTFRSREGVPLLQRDCIILAVVNLLILPVTLLFMLVFFLLSNAEDLHANRGAFATRVWSTRALWLCRLYHELPHEFNQRMQNAANSCDAYLSVFPASLISLFSSFIAFVSASFIAVIVLVTFGDASALTDQRIGDRTLLWWLAIFTAILAISRSLMQGNDIEHNKYYNKYINSNKMAGKQLHTYTRRGLKDKDRRMAGGRSSILLSRQLSTNSTQSIDGMNEDVWTTNSNVATIATSQTFNNDVNSNNNDNKPCHTNNTKSSTPNNDRNRTATNDSSQYRIRHRSYESSALPSSYTHSIKPTNSMNTSSRSEPARRLITLCHDLGFQLQRWTQKPYSIAVRNDIASLYTYKLKAFAQDLVAALLFPFVMGFSIHDSIPDVVEFIDKTTTHVPGLGDVVEFAVFKSSQPLPNTSSITLTSSVSTPPSASSASSATVSSKLDVNMTDNTVYSLPADKLEHANDAKTCQINGANDNNRSNINSGNDIMPVKKATSRSPFAFHDSESEDEYTPYVNRVSGPYDPFDRFHRHTNLPGKMEPYPNWEYEIHMTDDPSGLSSSSNAVEKTMKNLKNTTNNNTSSHLYDLPDYDEYETLLPEDPSNSETAELSRQRFFMHQ